MSLYVVGSTLSVVGHLGAGKRSSIHEIEFIDPGVTNYNSYVEEAELEFVARDSRK